MLYLPLRVILLIGNLYSKLIKIIDKRNYDTFWQEIMQMSIDSNVSRGITISPGKEIKFYCPSKMASFRVKTLYTKEPETIRWMDRCGSEEKILYDIGANIGLYAIYYAKKFNSEVYAFEPSFRNLDLLSRNVKLNLLKKKVFIIPNPISKKLLISDFFQLQAIAGHATATFNDEFVKNDFIKELRNNKSNDTIQYKTLGLSIDNLVDLKLIKSPNLIKIDVDGNELDVINGCKKTIQDQEKINILIETRKKTHNEIDSVLRNLKLKKVNQHKDNSIWEK